MGTKIKNVDRHLALLHCALTAPHRIEMRRNGRWMPVVATVTPSPYPRTDELHYYVVNGSWADYVPMSESTDVLRIAHS